MNFSATQSKLDMITMDNEHLILDIFNTESENTVKKVNIDILDDIDLDLILEYEPLFVINFFDGANRMEFEEQVLVFFSDGKLTLDQTDTTLQDKFKIPTDQIDSLLEIFINELLSTFKIDSDNIMNIKEVQPYLYNKAHSLKHFDYLDDVSKANFFSLTNDIRFLSPETQESFVF